MIEKIRLGASGLSASRVAVGTMGLGGGWDDQPLTSAEVSQARDLVETALDADINLFDHADIYKFGKAEACFGELLRDNPSLRERMLLQTKCGIRVGGRDGNAVNRYDLSADYIRQAVEASLRRLQTDRLDLLLLHRPDPLWHPEDIAAVFQELKKAGKVRAFGVSNMNSGQIRLLSAVLAEPLAVNQVELSLGHRDFIEAGVTWNHGSRDRSLWWAEGTLEECQLRGIRLQAWSPSAGGRLQKEGPTVGEIHRQADHYQVSSEAIVLAWLLRHPAGIQPVLGTTKPERLTASLQALTVEMTAEDWYRLWTAARGGDLP